MWFVATEQRTGVKEGHGHQPETYKFALESGADYHYEKQRIFMKRNNQ